MIVRTMRRRPCSVWVFRRTDQAFCRRHAPDAGRYSALMLAIRELRKVAWRGPRARDRYLGYLTLTDEAVRLSGRDESTSVDVALSIPHAALRAIRASEGTIVLELADGEIVVTPVDGSTAEVERLAHRLAAAAEPPSSPASRQSSPMRSLASA